MRIGLGGIMMLGEAIGYLSDVSSIVAAIVMIIQGVRFLHQKRKYEKRIESLNELRNGNSDYVINMSGHAINDGSRSVENWLVGKTVIAINPNVNQGKTFQNLDDLVQEADRLISEIPVDVLERVSRASAITFALPGMSMLTTILLTKIHALQGVFPLVTVSIRDNFNGEFVWQEPMDLQHIRTKHRGARDVLQ